jgi:hypothetical protein
MDLAETVGAIGIIATAFVGLSKLRPVRWLARTILADPIDRWLTTTIRSEVNDALEDLKTEFRPNGGSSMHDRINRLETKLDKVSEWIAGK